MYSMCSEYREPTLDIFSHILNKSLTLINYRLNPGQCEGLFKACCADEELLQNLIVENCGLEDSTLARIVNGLEQ